MFQTLIGTKKNAMNDLLYQTTEYALGLIAAGNEAGIDILYEYMGKTMLFVAKNVVKDDFAAEDVVQESFLKIVKNISKYKKGTNGYAWVCRIVRNTALNALKSENVRGGRSIDEFVNIADGKDFEEMSQTRMLAEKMHKGAAHDQSKNQQYRCKIQRQLPGDFIAHALSPRNGSLRPKWS